MRERARGSYEPGGGEEKRSRMESRDRQAPPIPGRLQGERRLQRGRGESVLFHPASVRGHPLCASRPVLMVQHCLFFPLSFSLLLPGNGTVPSDWRGRQLHL